MLWSRRRSGKANGVESGKTPGERGSRLLSHHLLCAEPHISHQTESRRTITVGGLLSLLAFPERDNGQTETKCTRRRSCTPISILNSHFPSLIQAFPCHDACRDPWPKPELLPTIPPTRISPLEFPCSATRGIKYSRNSTRLVICWDVGISGLIGMGSLATNHKPQVATRPGLGLTHQPRRVWTMRR